MGSIKVVVLDAKPENRRLYTNYLRFLLWKEKSDIFFDLAGCDGFLEVAKELYSKLDNFSNVGEGRDNLRKLTSINRRGFNFACDLKNQSTRDLIFGVNKMRLAGIKNLAENAFSVQFFEKKDILACFRTVVSENLGFPKFLANLKELAISAQVGVQGSYDWNFHKRENLEAVDSIVSPHVFDVFFDTFFAEANFEGMSISLDDDNKKQVCPSCINTERILSISNKLEECLKLSRDNPFADACYQFDDARRELRS